MQLNHPKKDIFTLILVGKKLISVIKSHKSHNRKKYNNWKCKQINLMRKISQLRQLFFIQFCKVVMENILNGQLQKHSLKDDLNLLSKLNRVERLVKRRYVNKGIMHAVAFLSLQAHASTIDVIA